VYDRYMNHAAWAWAHDPQDFGAIVRRARVSRSLQQSELAERIGVSRMTVSRLEHGEAVGLQIAIRALSECGVALVAVPKFSRVQVEAEPDDG
jgi:HTH-type transcriptional regulator / antitoxin HipB